MTLRYPRTVLSLEQSLTILFCFPSVLYVVVLYWNTYICRVSNKPVSQSVSQWRMSDSHSWPWSSRPLEYQVTVGSGTPAAMHRYVTFASSNVSTFCSGASRYGTATDIHVHCTYIHAPEQNVSHITRAGHPGTFPPKPVGFVGQIHLKTRRNPPQTSCNFNVLFHW